MSKLFSNKSIRDEKGRFVKGHIINKGKIGYWKGKKFSDEHKKNMSKNNAKYWRGKKLSEETKKKLSVSHKGKPTWNKGKKDIYSKETLQKLSNSHKGKHPKTEFKKGQIGLRKGIEVSEKTKQKQSEIHIKYIQDHPEEKERLKLIKPILPLKDTSIEIALQTKLTELGITFEKHKALIGRPDIFIEPNICIFADGCWWHGCEQCINKNKMSNWIRARQVSDIIITQKLIEAGYKVFRFWEHDIKKNVDACVAQIQIELNREIKI